MKTIGRCERCNQWAEIEQGICGSCADDLRDMKGATDEPDAEPCHCWECEAGDQEEYLRLRAIGL